MGNERHYGWPHPTNFAERSGSNALYLQSALSKWSKMEFKMWRVAVVTHNEIIIITM